MSDARLGDDESRLRLDRRVLGRSLLFVATFSLIFILLELSATAAGSFLFNNEPLLNQISAVAIIAMRVPFLPARSALAVLDHHDLPVQGPHSLPGLANYRPRSLSRSQTHLRRSRRRGDGR